jgi:hypothetical protein
MARRTPPRYVPTLTEVVHPQVVHPAPMPLAEAPAATPTVSQEDIVRRVMERVDATFEQRLREALAAAVIEQTRALGPMVRDEIEAVVRQAVAEAFEREFGHAPRS